MQPRRPESRIPRDLKKSCAWCACARSQTCFSGACRKNSGASNKEEFEKKAQKIAGDLRERLAKGEDPDVLEKEAYTALALEAKPMPTDFGSRRKGSLPPEQDQEIFSLSPGSATKVEPLPPGFVIYKVESRQTLPLDKVEDEISREIFRRK